MARQPPTMQASRIRGRRMLSTAAFAHRFFLFYTIWAGDATCVCDIVGLMGHHIEFYRARGGAPGGRGKGQFRRKDVKSC